MGLHIEDSILSSGNQNSGSCFPKVFSSKFVTLITNRVAHHRLAERDLEHDLSEIIEATTWICLTTARVDNLKHSICITAVARCGHPAISRFRARMAKKNSYFQTAPLPRTGGH